MAGACRATTHHCRAEILVAMRPRILIVQRGYLQIVPLRYNGLGIRMRRDLEFGKLVRAMAKHHLRIRPLRHHGFSSETWLEMTEDSPSATL